MMPGGLAAFVCAALCTAVGFCGLRAAGAAPTAESRAFFAKPLTLGAHRGGRVLWPENTLVAFTQAATRWPDVLLEGDLQVTADGHVVLLHDWTVDRTTDGTGRIVGKTLAEVRALDAGCRFTPDRGKTFPYRGKGIGIPTLAEVLDALPNARFLFEMKGAAGIADATVRIIQQANAVERVALASFNSWAMQRVRELAPRIICCYDINTGLGMVKALRGAHWNAYQPAAGILALDDDAIRGFALTPDDFRAIRSKGIAVLIHTINDRREMRSYLDTGVDSILTDRPDVLAEVLAKAPRAR